MKKSKSRKKPLLALSQETIRVLATKAISVVGGRYTETNLESGCPSCEPQ